MKKRYMGHQGDVLLERVKSLPDGCKKIKTPGEEVILAFGEKTGHKHKFLDCVSEYVGPNGLGYIQVHKEVGLLHEEHGTWTLTPGFYVFEIQRQFLKQVERVAD